MLTEQQICGIQRCIDVKTKAISMKKMKSTPRALTKNLRYLLTFGLAFLVSNANMMGALSPFGVAVTAAVPGGAGFAAFLGSLLGYIVFGGVTGNLSYIAALLLVAAAKFAFSAVTKLRENVAFLSLLAGAATIGTGITVVLSAGYNLPDLILRCCEGVLAGTMTYFTCAAYRAVSSDKPIRSFSVIELSSLLIVAGMAVLSLYSFQVGYLNIGRCVGILLTLFLLSALGPAGAAAGGILAALSAILFQPEAAGPAGFLIIAAFFAGLFRPLGRLVQVTVFIVTNSAGALILGAGEQALLQMVDVFAATVVFMFIRESFLERIASVFTPTQTRVTDMGANATISSKLDFASRTLTDLEESVQAVSKKMNELALNDISAVYNRTAESTCRRCGLKMFCWETAYSDTMGAFNSATATLRNNGRMTKEDAPVFFQQKCCKLGELVATLNHNYQAYIAKENAMRRVSDARSVAIEQFEGIANMLCEMSREIGEVSRFDESSAQKVRELMYGYGIHPTEICCLIDRYGRMGVEVYLDETPQTKLSVLGTGMCDTLEREFDLPTVMEADGKVKLAFFEKANYVVDFHAAQIACGNNKLCGDSFEYFVDAKGFVHMLLSDGMGTGGRAAVDSAMTCSLLLKLIKAGFGFESALRLINSSLLIKSGDESLATLDVVCLDLYTGKADFLKAGAANSFVKKGGHVIRVDSGSLPVGILRDVNYDKRTMKIDAGDMIVMVSDGVLATGTDWVEAEIELYTGKDAEGLAERIANEAKRRRIDGHSDDITVMAARIGRG